MATDPIGIWLPWSGGEPPKVTGKVMIKCRNGATGRGLVDAYDWEWTDEPTLQFCDIVEYMILEDQGESNDNPTDINVQPTQG